jgi:hypothetical protein
MGHKDMWALRAILNGKHEKTVDRQEKVAEDAVTAARITFHYS